MDREAFCSAGGSPVSGVGGGREPRKEKDAARGCPFRFGRIPPPENPCTSAGGSAPVTPPDFLFRRTPLPPQARQGSFSLVAGFVALSEKPPVSYESPRRSRGTVRQEGDVPTRFQTPRRTLSRSGGTSPPPPRQVPAGPPRCLGGAVGCFPSRAGIQRRRKGSPPVSSPREGPFPHRGEFPSAAPPSLCRPDQVPWGCRGLLPSRA